MSDEFYPMPAFPVLEAQDVARLAQWYVDVLDFKLVFSLPAPDATGMMQLAHLRFAKYADVLVRHAPPAAGKKGIGILLNFQAHGRVDEIAARARDMGATIVEGPVDRPWNTREIIFEDPEGYRVGLTQVLNPNLKLEEVPAFQHLKGARA